MQSRTTKIVLRTFIRSSSRAHVLVRVYVMRAYTPQCCAPHIVYDVHISMMNGCKLSRMGERASTTCGKQKSGRKGREKKERESIYIDELASIAFNAFAPPIYPQSRVATNRIVAFAATAVFRTNIAIISPQTELTGTRT